MRDYCKQSVKSPALGCLACTTPAHAQLFDRLQELTGEPHGILHALRDQSRSIEQFRKKVDSLAKKRGNVIDWNKALPTAKSEPAPPAPSAAVTPETPDAPVYIP